MQHGNKDSFTTEKVLLAPDDGVFELAGTEPVWIWVHTCPKSGCSCRSALVLATRGGRDQLLERGAAVRDAWNAGGDYLSVAKALAEFIVFHLDIDTGEALSPDTTGLVPLDLAAHPRIADIAMRIDGDLLDSFGQLWYRSKGWPDPEQQALLATEIKIKGWKSGDMLAWNDVCTGVRQDYYVIGGSLYEADEMYCPTPDCDCGEVLISFNAIKPEGIHPPGVVLVQRSGATEIKPNKTGCGRLNQLWAAFQQRHPNYLARFARRYHIMKNIGTRIVATLPEVRVTPKTGRNDPCPCGSGKKYKKCCGTNL